MIRVPASAGAAAKAIDHLWIVHRPADALCEAPVPRKARRVEQSEGRGDGIPRFQRTAWFGNDFTP